jgi:endonuclease YncB( thermonuclease family)
VGDGNTFETASRRNPVRLANVNSPEKGRSGSASAKKALEDLMLGETVTIETEDRDSYGRYVAKVKLGRRSVNETMKKHER